MNELLQRHGCSNVFTIPEGLKELMADISREVLRDQPAKIFDYIANYLSVLLITREHGILSVKIVDDLCDCRPSVSEHLVQLGITHGESEILAQVIKEEIEGFEPEVGKEKVKETQILKKILARVPLDEEMAAQVCQVARNAYRDYSYRKQLMEKNLKVQPHEAWEAAAERTLELYKRTKPSFSELTRATQKIQAAYRGYYVRRNLLRHLKPKKVKQPKVDLPGPPIDIAGSREIDLGPVINVRVRAEDTTAEFKKEVGKSLHLSYDPMKTITHVDMPGYEEIHSKTLQIGGLSEMAAIKSVSGSATSEVRKSNFKGMDQPDPLEEPLYKLPHLEDVSKAEQDISHFSDPEILIKDTAEAAPGKSASQDSVEQAKLALNTISFAEKHDEEWRSGVAKIVAKNEGKVEEAEIPEEIPAAPTAEDTQEVPEDISDDRTDSAPEAYDSAPEAYDSAAEDGDSYPISDLSSAPATEDDEE